MKSSLIHLPDHPRAVAQAVFVVFLWATSWVLIKIGLGAIPALTFAGLRYGLAFVALALFALRPARLSRLRQMPRSAWLRLAVLGLLFYALTQGAIFVTLSLLPAITTNLLWSFSTVAAALLGIVFLAEKPGPVQWGGMALYMAGVIVYFVPLDVPAGQVVGFVAAAIGVLANAGASVLGREVNRRGDLDPVEVTLVSMGIGGAALLIAGVAVQGLPALTLRDWAIVAWLAVVNTAFAFTLWNHTLRTLSAMESSVINSLMMVFIPLLAWLFLSETISTQEGLGMLIAGVGVLIVQMRRQPQSSR